MYQGSVVVCVGLNIPNCKSSLVHFTDETIEFVRSASIWWKFIPERWSSIPDSLSTLNVRHHYGVRRDTILPQTTYYSSWPEQCSNYKIIGLLFSNRILSKVL